MKWKRSTVSLRRVLETKVNNDLVEIIFGEKSIKVGKHKLKGNKIKKGDILLIYGANYENKVKSQIIYNISQKKYIEKGIPNILNLLVTLFLIIILVYLYFTNMLLHTIGPFERVFTISVFIYLHFILFECAKGFIHVKLYLLRNKSKIKNIHNKL